MTPADTIHNGSSWLPRDGIARLEAQPYRVFYGERRQRPDAFLEFAAMLRDTGLSHEKAVLEKTGHNLGHYYERSALQMLSFVGKYFAKDPVR